MVLKTRTNPVIQDFEEIVDFDTVNSPPERWDNSFQLGFLNSVTADYPDWNWRELIARGEQATSLLYGTRTFYTAVPHLLGGRPVQTQPNRSMASEPFSAFVKYAPVVSPNDETTNSVLSRIPGFAYPQFHIDPAGILSRVDSLARQRFASKVVKAQKKFDSLVFGGELRETIDLIRRPGRALRRLLDGHVAGFLKKGSPRRFPSRKSAQNYVSDRWLEFSFGVKPLVSDVKDGAEALASILTDVAPDVKVTAFATDLEMGSFGGSGLRRFEHSILDWESSSTQSAVGCYVKYFGSVYCPRFLNGHIPFETLGVTYSNVLPAFYELIPYSFLLDYFTNVGAIIEAFSYGDSTLRWVSKSYITHCENQWNDVTIKPADDMTQIVKAFHWTPGSRYYYVERSVHRDVYVGTIVPDLQFRLPGSLQWLNIAALLGASSRGRKRINDGILRRTTLNI